MKRLVWLLLIAFCTALAQVQPVDVPLTKQAKCGCCDDQAGACGMPDCIPQPHASQPVALQSPAGRQAEAGKLTHARRERFYVRIMPLPTLSLAAWVSVATEPVASVPLFKAHCSFLI